MSASGSRSGGKRTRHRSLANWPPWLTGRGTGTDYALAEFYSGFTQLADLSSEGVSMAFSIRRTWSEGAKRRDDYVILYGVDVGRCYLEGRGPIRLSHGGGPFMSVGISALSSKACP